MSRVREAGSVAFWVGLVLLVGAALAHSEDPVRTIPDAGVVVSEAVVKARLESQPDLEDDLAAKPGAAGDSAEADVDLSQFVHRIVVGNAGGTCVSLGNGLYVTAGHVVIHGQSPIVTIDGVRVRGEWGFAKSPLDFAVIQTEHITPGVPFSTDVHASGSAVAVGIPWTGETRTCPATLTDSEHFSVLSGPGCESGMSGGGVFADGQLIGVLWGFSSGNPAAGWFTPLSAVAALLGRTPPPPASAAPGDKPVVWMDVPSNFHCSNCDKFRGDKIAGIAIEVRERVNDQRGSWPHFHLVNSDGTETCLGAQASVQSLVAAALSQAK